MCVIAIYQNGKRPDSKTVEQMVNHNGDGIGIAWNDGNEIFFRKGFTTAKAVMRFAHLIPDTARDIIFHARIATSGGISAEKCHPFIVSTNNKALNTTEGRGKTPLLFHNGIFSIDVEDGLNDTQTVTKHIVAPLMAIGGKKLRDGKFNKLLNAAFGSSRVVLLYPDGIQTFGQWQTRDGVMYSNLNHEPRTYNYSQWAYPYANYNRAWGYDDDDDGYSAYYTAANTKREKPFAEKSYYNGLWHINNYTVPRRKNENATVYYRRVCDIEERANRFQTPPWLECREWVNTKPVSWDGKESEFEYNKRVAALRNAHTTIKPATAFENNNGKVTEVYPV